MKTAIVASQLLALLAAAATAKPVDRKHQAPFGYTSGSAESVANLKDKIENVVWILLENRAYDNILGGVKNRDLDNVVNNGPFCNPQDVSQPDGAKWCSVYKDFDSVLDDPNHSITGNNLEFYGSYSPNNAAIANGTLTPSLQGFIEEQLSVHKGLDPKTAAEQVMGYYSEDEIPTLVQLVDEFTTFNYWHSCVPGPTNPNRLCAVAGTAAGHGRNDESFMNASITTPNIFEQVDNKGISWRNYDGTNGAFPPDALFFNWISQNRQQNVVPLENFFQDAYLGQLPQLSYINPSCCGLNTNSMHPSGNVSYGQVLVKQIYDSIRTGPQWEKTLLLITFDETGGFFDHVAPPLAVRPDNLTYTETAKDGSSYTFDFDRLGGRLPTWLISPYAARGHVEDNGTDPASGEESAYSATSVLKTLNYLWDLEDFTPRVSHSPAFDHLIGPHFRHNTPETLENPHVFPEAV